MKEIDFFKHYSTNQKEDDSYLNNCLESIAKTEKEIPELPFSNLWIAQKLHDKMMKRLDELFAAKEKEILTV